MMLKLPIDAVLNFDFCRNLDDFGNVQHSCILFEFNIVIEQGMMADLPIKLAQLEHKNR